MWLTDSQKIGVFLTAFGLLFMLLGVFMLFDAALIAMGNLLFLSGLTLVIGFAKTFYFFARKQKMRGSICFLGGIVLVFLKRPVFGVCIEAFGFLNLFGYVMVLVALTTSDFFPVAISFMKNLPVVGPILRLPYIASAVDRLSGVRSLPV
ncbi:Protein transport protein GOT1 [Neolecta irregularis DAH-3]|uniref:Protein transport protein GOT1 n=1 Tax=Neolecta irregularis (strain DAH-3) TaxID=1198029 RepID=A0A1U7LH94_NEOID|nr:Protein transport protein GOT1 [Neolecta irregularis DAH-3]|eukprot:OLL21998.1 Protein transport protein GOT1 [Neolecta irregularis DAH-3]